ncbi:hypothetical protein BH09MYX1_BH09MYX1_37910 [soil metagenome]
MRSHQVEGRVASALACVVLIACSSCSSDPPADPGFTSDAGGDVNPTIDAAPLAPATLIVSRVGQGTVASLPTGGIDCGATCTKAFPSGTTIVLKAVADVGWEFSGWSDGPPTCTGTGSCAITLGSENLKVTATFFQPTAELTVTKVGNGTVTSAPAGIACGLTCNAPFDTGSNVTLTAAPAGGYVFVGWTGACSGVGPCVVTTVGPKTVTANFAINYTTWDPSYSVAGVSYANGNRSISGNSAGSKNVRTLVGKSSGKWYWEITTTGGDGTTDAGGIGILESGMPNSSSYMGSSPSGLGFGYGSCCYSTYYMNWSGATLLGQPPPLGSAIKAGIIYMFALDMDTKRAWFGQNGAWYNGGNPSASVNAAVSNLSGTVYPGVTFYSASINTFTANFGQAGFSYGVPSGFNAGLY